MIRPNGVHHLAIATANMKEQLSFFNEVLGMELVALYWMHGVDGAWHGFMKASDECYIAFVGMDSIGKIPIEIGKTHAGNGALPCAPGTMQHVALNVDTESELITLRDRIRSRGVNVFGPLNHGFCKSIYFAGPEQLTLEIATSEEAIDGNLWIDPEVVALVGISAEELGALRSPQHFAGDGGRIPQPPMDPSKPRSYQSPERYAQMLKMTDEEFGALSIPDPPVKAKTAA